MRFTAFETAKRRAPWTVSQPTSAVQIEQERDAFESDPSNNNDRKTATNCPVLDPVVEIRPIVPHAESQESSAKE